MGLPSKNPPISYTELIGLFDKTLVYYPQATVQTHAASDQIKAGLSFLSMLIYPSMIGMETSQDIFI